MKRVRLGQVRTAHHDTCLITETTLEQRNAELGEIAADQNRYCRKCERFLSEAEIAANTCDRFGNWSSK